MTRLARECEKRKGFTLVEVLVAMSISAVVAVLAYESLAAATDATERSQAVAAQLDAIDRTWQMLERDLQHVVAGPPSLDDSATDKGAVDATSVENTKRSSPIFVGKGSAQDTRFTQADYVLRLIRRGWSNPLQQQRSELQGVGYLLAEGSLYRQHWPRLNSDALEQAYRQENPATRFLLVEGVESLTLRYLPATAKSLDINAWKDSWPGHAGADEAVKENGDGKGKKSQPSSVPVAVEITLAVENFGESSRVFFIAAGLL